MPYGYSKEERFIFRNGCFFFPSRFTIAVIAFTSTFSPDEVELTVTLVEDCVMPRIERRQQNIANSFFIVGSTAKIKITESLCKGKSSLF